MPFTFVKIWTPRAPSTSMACPISATHPAGLFIGKEATKAGNLSGWASQISFIDSFANRARARDSSGPANSSMGGDERVRIC